jgi:RHH-type rel operon transcriptional repressor/antitoxin RelB
MIAVRLPPQVERRLEDLARKIGRSKNLHVRKAILRHLNALRGYYLAAQRLKKNLPDVPLEEVSAVSVWRIEWRTYRPRLQQTSRSNPPLLTTNAS